MKKINNKGFSLTELLGVAIVLGLIVAIVTPIINGILKDNRNKLYKEQINGIVESAKTWSSKHINELPGNNEIIEVTLGELKQGGFASKDLKNPKNEKLFDDAKTYVIIRNYNGILDYEVIVEE